MLAIAASLVVALTVTPALCLILLRGARLEGRESPVIVWLLRHYAPLLERVTRTPRLAYIAVGVVTLVRDRCLAAARAVAAAGVQGARLPDALGDQARHVASGDAAHHDRAPARSCAPSPACATSAPTSARPSLADEVVGVNFGENWISIDQDADYDKTHARIEDMVDGYPGLYRDVQTYLKERIREVLTGAGEAIVVRIFGPDLDVLRDKAEEVRAALADVPDLVDLHKELMVEVPHIQVTVKLDEARRYGLKPGDVRRAAATLMAGEEVGDIFLGGRPTTCRCGRHRNPATAWTRSARC